MPGRNDNAVPIVVTGAAGFIGSHVAQALLARGRAVIGIDNLDPFYNPELKRANLTEVRSQGGCFEVVEMDLCDADALAALFKDRRPEGVIHLAAKAGVRPSIADPVGYMHANVTGTTSVLRAATESGCARALVASSSSVYGNNTKTPFAEDDPVEHPISPYAASKRACELICGTHHHLTGLPIACLRFFTVFGPRQRPDLAIAKFMRLIDAGEPIPVFGDGSMSRDFTFIDDIVTGVLAGYDTIDRHGCRTWNLGSDRPTRLDDLIDAVAQVVGTRPIIDAQPVPAGDVDRTWADLTRSEAELGYTPKTSLADGLEAQWAWFRATRV